VFLRQGLSDDTRSKTCTLTTYKALNLPITPACEIALSKPTEHFKRDLISRLSYPATLTQKLGIVVLSIGYFLRPLLRACTISLQVSSTLYTILRLCRAIDHSWTLSRFTFYQILLDECLLAYVAICTFFTGLGMIIEMITGESTSCFSLSGGYALMVEINVYFILCFDDELSWHATSAQRVFMGYSMAVALFFALCIYAGVEASGILLRPQDSDCAVLIGCTALTALAAVMPTLFLLTLKRQRRYHPARRWYKQQ